MLLKLFEVLRKPDIFSKTYQGIVVDNADPKKLGRIRCKVEDVLESPSNSRLPWCYPQNPFGLGGRIDLSSFSVPEIDSEVVISFPYQDIYYPVYIGFRQNTPTTHQTLFDEDYPESYGWIDSVIQWFKSNKAKPYLEYFRQTLKDCLRLDEQGNLWINVPKSLIINVGGHFHLNVLNDFNTQVGNNVNIAINGYHAESITGNHSLDIGGAQDILCGGIMKHQAIQTHHNAGASPTPPAMGELQAKVNEFNSKLDDLLTQANELEGLRDNIKNTLATKAADLIGSG